MEEQVLTLAEIEKGLDTQSNQIIPVDSDWTPKERTLPLTDALKTYSFKKDLVESILYKPEAGVGTKIGYGLKRVYDSFADLDDNTKNLMVRALDGYVYPNMTEEQATELLESGTRSMLAIRSARAMNEEYAGVADSDWTKWAGMIGQVGAYALAGLATGGAAIGILAGVQSAGDKSQEWAEKYFQENYGMKGYNGTKDSLWAIAHGVVSGYVEKTIGVESMLTNAFTKSGLKEAAKFLKRGTAGAFAKQALAEGAEEGVQELSGFIFGKFANAEDRTWAEALLDAGENAIYGAILGGAFGGVTYYKHRSKLASLFKDKGFSDDDAVKLAEAFIDEGKQGLIKEISTVGSLKNNVGGAFDNLVGKIESALTSAGWTDTDPFVILSDGKIERKSQVPDGTTYTEANLHEYATYVASDIAGQVLRQAETGQIPTTDVLDLAEIEVVDNMLLLKPQNLRTSQQIKTRLDSVNTDIKAINKEIRLENTKAKTLQADPARVKQLREAKKNLVNKAGILQKLLEHKQSIERTENARREQKKKEIGLDTTKSFTDAQTVSETQNAGEFTQKITETAPETDTKTAQTRYKNAVVAWLCDGDTVLFDKLMTSDGMTAGAIDSIVQFSEQIIAFDKAHPELGLRADIKNALQNMLELKHRGEFRNFVSQQGTFSENALMYNMVFAENGSEIGGFLQSYMQKAESNKNFTKKDLLSQTLHETYPNVFDGETATDKDILAVFVSQNNLTDTEQPLYQKDYTDLAEENARLDDIYPEYTGETIEIDGKERTVYNSNGERIAKSEPALRNFWNWFGDSKVVDDKGRPLVVYHSTGADFNTFDITKAQIANYGRGFYFTAKKGQFDYVVQGKKKEPISAYLSLKNPVFMQDFINLGKIHELLKDNPLWIGDGKKNSLANRFLASNTRFKFINLHDALAAELAKQREGKDYSDDAWYEAKDDINRLFQEMGFDGLVVREDFSEIVVFPNYEYQTTKNTIERVLSMEPVSVLTGQEFQKDGTPLTTKVNDYYKENYNSQVERDGVGVIKLDMRSIKDSMAHGISKEKSAAFMAVPEIIKNGLIFDEQTQWKGRNYDSVSFIAPITINGERYACEVIVKKTEDRTGFYLHNVEIENKLADVLKTRPDSEFSTGTTASSKLSIAKKWGQVKTTSQIKSTQNRGTFSLDTGNIYKQRTQVNGMYDPELNVIVLGRNFNTTTLPHEMAHFWLENTFRLYKRAKNGGYPVAKEWLDEAERMFQILDIDPSQSTLTEEQQEKWASMNEAIITGLAYIPDGATRPITGYLNWVPEKYRSILNIGYRNKDGKIVNPVLDKAAVDFFNIWYGNVTLPALPTSPARQESTNMRDSNGEIVPSSTIQMRERTETVNRAIKEQTDADKALYESAQDELDPEIRAEISAEYTKYDKVSQELPKLPEPKSWFRAGKRHKRDEIVQKAREYVKKNPDHAREVAMLGMTELNDTDVDLETLILAVMEMDNIAPDSDLGRLYEHNIAMTRSKAGTELGLHSKEGSYQTYLDAYRRMTAAMEETAAYKYAGRGADAVQKLRNDTDALVAKYADAVFSGKMTQEQALKAMCAEASVKFTGEELTGGILHQLDLGTTLKTREAFVEYAKRIIRKDVLKAEPNVELQGKLLAMAPQAEQAAKDINSPDPQVAAAGAKKLREWGELVRSKDPGQTRFGAFVNNLAPRAMLSGISTHVVNPVSTGLNWLLFRKVVKGHYGDNIIPQDVLDAETARIKSVYNATFMNLTTMVTPTDPSLVHGEKYKPLDPGAKGWQKVYDAPMRALAAEDNWFRIPSYIDIAARMASRDSEGNVNKAIELFKQYTQTQPKKINGKENELFQKRTELVNTTAIATFTESGKLAMAMNKMRDGLNSIGGQNIQLGTLIAPFVKTPANIIERGLRPFLKPINTLGTLAKITGLKKGDIAFNDRLDLYTTFVLTAAIGAALVGLDDDDYVAPYSGGKYDPKKPYNSVRIGGVWIKLDIFGPFEPALKMVLSLKSGEKAGKAVIEQASQIPVVGELLNNQTAYMVNNPAGYAAKTVYNQAHKAVPAIIKNVARFAGHATGYDAGFSDIDVGFNTGIGRSLERTYGIDGTEFDFWNDFFGLVFNRIRVE